MISLSNKSPEKIIRDILWILHITLLCKVKLQFLTLFLLVDLAYPIMCRLMLFLHYFTAFTSYTIDQFVSNIPKPIFSILLGLIYFTLTFDDMLLSEEVQFLSEGFPFLVTSMSSGVIFCSFITWNIHTVLLLHISVFYLLFILVLFVLLLVTIISLLLLFFI